MVDLSGVTPLRAVQNSQRAEGQARVHQPTRVAADAAATSLPQLVRLATELSSAAPPVDHARIAEIRAAIAGGNYHVDPDRIALALLGGGE